MIQLSKEWIRDCAIFKESIFGQRRSLLQLWSYIAFFIICSDFMIKYVIKYTRSQEMIQQAILVIVFLYTSINAIAFLFPSLLHQKKNPSDPKLSKMLRSNKILNVAHRGGPRHTTQNTLQAFEYVGKATDCFEMDVCETKDKVLVVHHDHHLKRTCGIEANVEDYDYQKLPSFGKEIVLDFGVNQIVKTKNQKIPKLQQIFKKFPQTLMNIQLKTPTQSAISSFVDMLQSYNRINTTIIGIRSPKNSLLKAGNPNILTFMNDKKVFKLAAAYFTGWVGLLPIEEDSLQIPVYSKEFLQWNLARTPQAEKWKVRMFMIMVRVVNYLTIPLIWHLKRRGILTFGWVCNTEEAFDNAIKAGFQAIMTDTPFLLQKYLKQRNLNIQS